MTRIKRTVEEAAETWQPSMVVVLFAVAGVPIWRTNAEFLVPFLAI